MNYLKEKILKKIKTTSLESTDENMDVNIMINNQLGNLNDPLSVIDNNNESIRGNKEGSIIALRNKRKKNVSVITVETSESLKFFEKEMVLLKSHNERLKRRIDKLFDEKEKLKDQLVKTEKLKKSQDNLFEATEKHIEKLHEELKNMAKKNEIIKKDVKKKDIKILALESQLDIYQTDLTKRSNILKDELTYADLNKQLEHFKLQLKDKKEINNKIDVLQSQLVTLREETKKVDALKYENEKLKISLDEKSCVLYEIERSIEQIENNSDELTKKNILLSEENCNLKEEIIKLKQINSLSAEKQGNDLQNNEHFQKIQTQLENLYSDKIKLLKNHLEEKETKIGLINTLLKTSNEQTNQLNKKMRSVLKENKKLSKKYEKCFYYLEKLKEKYDQNVMDQLENPTDSLDEMKGKIESSEAGIQSIENGQISNNNSFNVADRNKQNKNITLIRHPVGNVNPDVGEEHGKKKEEVNTKNLYNMKEEKNDEEEEEEEEGEGEGEEEEGEEDEDGKFNFYLKKNSPVKWKKRTKRIEKMKKNSKILNGSDEEDNAIDSEYEENMSTYKKEQKFKGKEEEHIKSWKGNYPSARKSAFSKNNKLKSTMKVSELFGPPTSTNILSNDGPLIYANLRENENININSIFEMEHINDDLRNMFYKKKHVNGKQDNAIINNHMNNNMLNNILGNYKTNNINSLNETNFMNNEELFPSKQNGVIPFRNLIEGIHPNKTDSDIKQKNFIKNELEETNIKNVAQQHMFHKCNLNSQERNQQLGVQCNATITENNMHHADQTRAMNIIGKVNKDVEKHETDVNVQLQSQIQGKMQVQENMQTQEEAQGKTQEQIPMESNQKIAVTSSEVVLNERNEGNEIPSSMNAWKNSIFSGANGPSNKSDMILNSANEKNVIEQIVSHFNHAADNTQSVLIDKMDNLKNVMNTNQASNNGINITSASTENISEHIKTAILNDSLILNRFIKNYMNVNSVANLNTEVAKKEVEQEINNSTWGNKASAGVPDKKSEAWIIDLEHNNVFPYKKLESKQEDEEENEKEIKKEQLKKKNSKNTIKNIKRNKTEDIYCKDRRNGKLDAQRSRSKSLECRQKNKTKLNMLIKNISHLVKTEIDEELQNKNAVAHVSSNQIKNNNQSYNRNFHNPDNITHCDNLNNASKKTYKNKRQETTIVFDDTYSLSSDTLTLSNTADPVEVQAVGRKNTSNRVAVWEKGGKKSGKNDEKNDENKNVGKDITGYGTKNKDKKPKLGKNNTLPECKDKIKESQLNKMNIKSSENDKKENEQEFLNNKLMQNNPQNEQLRNISGEINQYCRNQNNLNLKNMEYNTLQQNKYMYNDPNHFNNSFMLNKMDMPYNYIGGYNNTLMNNGMAPFQMCYDKMENVQYQQNANNSYYPPAHLSNQMNYMNYANRDKRQCFNYQNNGMYNNKDAYSNSIVTGNNMIGETNVGTTFNGNYNDAHNMFNPMNSTSMFPNMMDNSGLNHSNAYYQMRNSGAVANVNNDILGYPNSEKDRFRNTQLINKNINEANMNTNIYRNNLVNNNNMEDPNNIQTVQNSNQLIASSNNSNNSSNFNHNNISAETLTDGKIEEKEITKEENCGAINANNDSTGMNENLNKKQPKISSHGNGKKAYNKNDLLKSKSKNTTASHLSHTSSFNVENKKKKLTKKTEGSGYIPAQTKLKNSTKNVFNYSENKKNGLRDRSTYTDKVLESMKSLISHKLGSGSHSNVLEKKRSITDSVKLGVGLKKVGESKRMSYSSTVINGSNKNSQGRSLSENIGKGSSNSSDNLKNINGAQLNNNLNDNSSNIPINTKENNMDYLTKNENYNIDNITLVKNSSNNNRNAMPSTVGGSFVEGMSDSYNNPLNVLTPTSISNEVNIVNNAIMSNREYLNSELVLSDTENCCFPTSPIIKNNYEEINMGVYNGSSVNNMHTLANIGSTVSVPNISNIHNSNYHTNSLCNMDDRHLKFPSNFNSSNFLNSSKTISNDLNAVYHHNQGIQENVHFNQNNENLLLQSNVRKTLTNFREKLKKQGILG